MVDTASGGVKEEVPAGDMVMGVVFDASGVGVIEEEPFGVLVEDVLLLVRGECKVHFLPSTLDHAGVIDDSVGTMVAFEFANSGLDESLEHTFDEVAVERAIRTNRSQDQAFIISNIFTSGLGEDLEPGLILGTRMNFDKLFFQHPKNNHGEDPFERGFAKYRSFHNG